MREADISPVLKLLRDLHPSRLHIHLPGRQHGQMARKDGSQFDGTLLVRYLARPHHPELDNLTYIEFWGKCRLEQHKPDEDTLPYVAQPFRTTKWWLGP
jgi:hypothetical protein